MVLVRAALCMREQVCDPLSAGRGTDLVTSVGPVRMVVAMVVGVKAGGDDDAGDERAERTKDERLVGTECAQAPERPCLTGSSSAVDDLESAHRCRPSRTAPRWIRDAR